MATQNNSLVDDILVKYISVKTVDSTDYQSKFNLQSTQVFMRCGYNTRNKMRWVILMDSNGMVLLPQTFIKFKKRCELNFLSNQYNLSYYLTLKPKDNTKVFSDTYDYLNWSKDFEMCFVGYEQTLVEKLDKNLRAVLVGN